MISIADISGKSSRLTSLIKGFFVPAPLVMVVVGKAEKFGSYYNGHVGSRHNTSLTLIVETTQVVKAYVLLYVL